MNEEVTEVSSYKTIVEEVQNKGTQRFNFRLFSFFIDDKYGHDFFLFGQNFVQ